MRKTKIRKILINQKRFALAYFIHLGQNACKMTFTEFELQTKAHFEVRLKQSFNQSIPVKHREKLTSLLGNTYEIDLHFEFHLQDIKYLTLIECKYWNTNVTREKVNAFKSVIDDLKAHKGVIVTCKGFQRGAVEYAKSQGIGLLKLTPKYSDIVAHFDGGINEAYEALVTESSVDYFTDNFTGLFFPSENSIWDFIAKKYGVEFGKFLLRAMNGEFDLDNFQEKIPEEFVPIIESMEQDWEKDFLLLESAGLKYKLENEQELRAFHTYLNMLRIRFPFSN